jgi:hypothetical protein
MAEKPVTTKDDDGEGYRNHQSKCRSAAMELSKETRQKFINGIWHGLTIQQAYEEVGISFEAALGIMNMNLVRETTLKLNLVSE